jgi:hypothetical protein
MKYYITVSRCNGPRGPLVSIDYDNNTMTPYGTSLFEHSLDFMCGVLGLFSLVLDPKSEQLSDEEVETLTSCQPLAEYHGQFGIALRSEQVGAT